MTDQISEKLECDVLDLGAWRLYGVIRGEPSAENHGWGDNKRVYLADPGEVDSETTCTANYKGFQEHWRLSPEGRLVLVAFEYGPLTSKPRIRRIGETIHGDFYLVLKSQFEGPRMYVAFRDGLLVTDRGAWKHEHYPDPQRFTAEIRPGPHP